MVKRVIQTAIALSIVILTNLKLKSLFNKSFAYGEMSDLDHYRIQT